MEPIESSQTSEGGAADVSSTATNNHAAATASFPTVLNKHNNSSIPLVSEQTNSEASQTTNTDIDFDSGVKLAVHFLTDPKVKYSPRQRKIAFLRGKGLSAEQISVAFRHTGEDVSINEINGVSATPHKLASTSHQNMTNNRSTSLSQLRNPYSISQNESNNQIYFRQPTQTHTLYPSLPPPSLTPVEQEAAHKSHNFDWRDVVIALGATLAAGWGGVKLFTRYSPYEFRRKDDINVSSSTLNYDSNAQDRGSYNDRYRMIRSSEYNSSQSNRQGRNLRNNLSNERVDEVNTNDVSLNVVESPLSRVHDKSRAVPPLPATPQNVDANKDKELAAELLQLKEEKKNLEEKLKKEQEKSAKLAMSSSQAQKSQKAVANKNVNLSMELEELKEKYEKLLQEKNDAAKSKEESETESKDEKEVSEKCLLEEEHSNVSVIDKTVESHVTESTQSEEGQEEINKETSEKTEEEVMPSEQTASKGKEEISSPEIVAEEQCSQPAQIVIDNDKGKETKCEETREEEVAVEEQLQRRKLL